MRRKTFDVFVNRLAREAHKKRLKTPRGTWDFGNQVVAFYESTSYEDPRSEQSIRRGAEHAELRKRLEKIGGRVIGEGAYPPPEAQNPFLGFTVVLMISGVAERDVQSTHREVLRDLAKPGVPRGRLRLVSD